VLTLATDGLAAYRLARLTIEDTLLDNPREGLLEWLEDQGLRGRKIAEGLRCWWCVGVWAAAAMVLLRRASPSLGGAVVDALAAATLVGFAAEWQEARA